MNIPMFSKPSVDIISNSWKASLIARQNLAENFPHQQDSSINCRNTLLSSLNLLVISWQQSGSNNWTAKVSHFGVPGLANKTCIE